MVYFLSQTRICSTVRKYHTDLPLSGWSNMHLKFYKIPHLQKVLPTLPRNQWKLCKHLEANQNHRQNLKKTPVQTKTISKTNKPIRTLWSLGKTWQNHYLLKNNKGFKTSFRSHLRCDTLVPHHEDSLERRRKKTQHLSCNLVVEQRKSAYEISNKILTV